MKNQHFQISTNTLEIQEYLSSQIPGWNVVVQSEHPSTQIMAKEAYKNGVREKTIFLVRKQTSGRGRKDRNWMSSRDGRDITMTLLIPLSHKIDNPSMMSLVGGISLAEALRQITSREFQVKWPNDVYFKNAKISGMLSEFLFDGDSNAVAMGMGINVNSDPDDFDSASSFYEIETVSSIYGMKVDLARLIIEIIKKVEVNLGLLNNDSKQLLQKWDILGWNQGKKIKYREFGEEWKIGKITGLSPMGYLIITEESGELTHTLIESDIVPIDS